MEDISGYSKSASAGTTGARELKSSDSSTSAVEGVTGASTEKSTIATASSKSASVGTAGASDVRDIVVFALATGAEGKSLFAKRIFTESARAAAIMIVVAFIWLVV